ncbi:hypothetical protein B0H13DRAFT_1887049 [Mycena leptocephala]|nr:hypothetical protein B0H13DRAFT_1887049 [Mycena leptocephala]
MFLEKNKVGVKGVRASQYKYIRVYGCNQIPMNLNLKTSSSAFFKRRPGGTTWFRENMVLCEQNKTLHSQTRAGGSISNARGAAMGANDAPRWFSASRLNF